MAQESHQTFLPQFGEVRTTMALEFKKVGFPTNREDLWGLEVAGSVSIPRGSSGVQDPHSGLFLPKAQGGQSTGCKGHWVLWQGEG